jgi:peptide/nickel transport system substrate-binding protein
MKKVIAILLLVMAGMLSVNLAVAQEAPSGTLLGTWPYVLPPDHHLNSFASQGLNDNLGVLYRPMVELTPAYFLWDSGEYEGFLAESWGFTDDGTAFWFKLKDGLLWSNGDSITADDVITTYAIGRVLNWSQFTYISDVEKVDDLTVRFVFKGEPSRLAERLILKESIVARANYGELAEKALAVVASGATRDDDAWKNVVAEINSFRPTELIASGPYTYSLSDVGDAFMTLRWQPNSIFSGSVKFGEIKIWAGETEVTAPLVLSGELAHSTNVYPPATIDSFVNAGIRITESPRGYGPALLFQHDTYPFNIKEVRQAMAHAINREQSAFLTNGIGATGTIYMSGILDSMAPSILPADVLDELNRYEYDLERAAELMEQAGFTRNASGKWVDGEGKTISVEYTFPADFADFSAAAQDATQQLNDFGFDIALRALPWQEAAAAIRAGDFQLSVWSWGSGSPFATTQFFGPTRRFNYVALANEQRGMNFPMEFEWRGEQIDLNALILNVSTGLDVEAQKERAGFVARIINDVLPFIPLNEMKSVEPINEALIAGVPEDGDPIFTNPSGDHYMIYLVLKGVVSPAGN